MTSADWIRIILELVALVGIVIGPIIAFFAGKHDSEAKLRLMDINAIKGWAEQRKNFEEDIKDLHEAVLEEQEMRRLDRIKYMTIIDEVKEEMRELRKQLQDCIEEEL